MRLIFYLEITNVTEKVLANVLQFLRLRRLYYSECKIVRDVTWEEVSSSRTRILLRSSKWSPALSRASLAIIDLSQAPPPQATHNQTSQKSVPSTFIFSYFERKIIVSLWLPVCAGLDCVTVTLLTDIPSNYQLWIAAFQLQLLRPGRAFPYQQSTCRHTTLHLLLWNCEGLSSNSMQV